jgi:hypothetical protein
MNFSAGILARFPDEADDAPRAFSQMEAALTASLKRR